jgi:hypothetical protein
MHSSHTTHETAYSGDPNIRTSPVSARWAHGVWRGSDRIWRYERRASGFASARPWASGRLPTRCRCSSLAAANGVSAFCAAYDEPRIAPRDVLEAASAKLRELVDFIEREAAAGDAAQQVVLARGDVALYERDIAYIQRLP